MLRAMLFTREAQGYRRLVREVLERRRYRPDWVMTTRWAFARDGKPLRRDVENGDGSEVHYVYSYDANGEWTRPDVRTVRGADGSFTEYWVLGADYRHGRMGFTPVPLVPVAFLVDGVAVVEAAYGSDGFPTGVRFRSADGTEVSELVYRLDDHGRVVEARQLSKSETGPLGSLDSTSALASDGAQAVAEAAFEYGRRDELLRYQATLGGMKLSPTMYAYNEHGDVALKSRFGEPGVRFEYEYDDQGNWVRQVSLVLDNPGCETLRALSYYPDAT